MLLISKNIKGLMHNYMASTNCFCAILIKYLNTLTFYHVSLLFLCLPFLPPKSRRKLFNKTGIKGAKSVHVEMFSAWLVCLLVFRLFIKGLFLVYVYSCMCVYC